MSVRRFNSSELIPLQLAFRLISKYRNQTFKQNSVIDKKGWYGKASSNKMFKKTLNNITISGNFFVSNDYFDKTGLMWDFHWPNTAWFIIITSTIQRSRRIWFSLIVWMKTFLRYTGFFHCNRGVWQSWFRSNTCFLRLFEKQTRFSTIQCMITGIGSAYAPFRANRRN